MVQDAENLHRIAAKPVYYAMTVANKAADTATPRLLGLAAQRMICEAIKAALNVILIRVGSRTSELRFAILPDVYKIAMRCPAQDDPSHVGRDAWRLFPLALRAHRGL